MGGPVRRIGTLDSSGNDKRSDKAENDDTAHQEVIRIFEEFAGVEQNEGKADAEPGNARTGQERPFPAVALDQGKRERPVRFPRSPDRYAEPGMVEKHQHNERIIARVHEPEIRKHTSVD